jgi:uncharacterized membrane protein
MFSGLQRTIRLALATSVVCLSAGLGVAGGATPAVAQTEKSFSLSELNTSATLNPDGSMAVEEEVTYAFSGGTFTFGIRSFQAKWRDRITGFTAADQNGAPLQAQPPTSTPSGEWQWSFPPSTGSKTFVLRYTVPDAVQVGSDVARLYWQFIGNDHPGVKQMRVNIQFAGEFQTANADTPPTDTSVIRVWAHPDIDGVIRSNPTSVEVEVVNVPSKTFVEADVVIPTKAFTVAGAKQLLPAILKQEANWANPGERGADRAKWLAPLLATLGLGGFGVAFVKWGKEPPVPAYIGDYWREPLEDPPAVVSATMSFGSVDGKAMASTMVDLAQRGVLTITERGETGFISKRPVYTFTATTPKPRVGHPLPPPPSAYEADLLANVFRGQNQVTSEDFNDWAKSNRSEAAAFWTGWKTDVSTDMKARGYIASKGVTSVLLPLGIAAALIASAAALVVSTNDSAGKPRSLMGLVCGAAGLLVLAMTPLMRKRSVKGTEQAAKAKALKKYLEDFSNMDEAPVASLVIWERFLVYAVALGCASKVYQGLRTRLPDMVNQGGFAPWYVPVYGHDIGSGLDRFPSDWGSTAQSAMAPQNTSSGSGGGFSGGGGGGGGGGGFGAG